MATEHFSVDFMGKFNPTLALGDESGMMTFRILNLCANPFGQLGLQIIYICQ